MEILVVMVIVGILTTTMLLSVGSREPFTLREARRLTELLRLAIEEAVINSQEWGLLLTSDGYEFMVLEGSTWRSANDEILRPRQFPVGLEPHLLIENQTLIIAANEDQNVNSNFASKTKQPQIITPQILILSSGEVSPFQISLDAEDQPSWRIIGDYFGNFTLVPSKIN